MAPIEAAGHEHADDLILRVDPVCDARGYRGQRLVVLACGRPAAFDQVIDLLDQVGQIRNHVFFPSRHRPEKLQEKVPDRSAAGSPDPAVGGQLVGSAQPKLSFGSGNATVPRAIFLEALLTEGGLGALLHYIYRLSAEAFESDPLAFCYSSMAAHKRLVFSSDDYMHWIEDQLANRLHVLRKVNARGGVSRKPLQAELALLRQLGIVEQGFRIGVGLPINWPVLQEAMSSVALH